MRLASLILSLCLHAAVLLLIVYWPTPPPLRLDTPPIMISLVDGAPGGARAPTPIMGHTGEPNQGELTPAPVAPQSEIAAKAREEVAEVKPEAVAKPVEIQQPVETPKQPEPIRVPEPVKTPEPVKAVEEKTETPKPEPVKAPEPPKPEPAKKPDASKPKKQEPARKPTQPKKPAADPVAQALAKARQATSRSNSNQKGNAVEQALAQARKTASGTGGGGGGDGDGPGGGGLGDVYIGAVMLAVRPNWGFASSARLSLSCVVKVNVDLRGNVQNAVISVSSGNAQFDASAVNAVVRTSQAGDFPAPPNLEYTNLDLVFTLDELRRR